MKVEVNGSEVSVTGDFFIEPPEAREEIEEVLVNLDHETDEEKIVEAVQSIEAQLIGFSAEDVAEAFREAVGGVQ